jgi:hypothetical protein
MRLLNTSSWKLEDFTDSDVPKYAILSHRWETEEITFQDLQLVPTRRETKKGWSKLRGCVAQAVQDGFQWIWVDTCCIDKSSSAELSEAINSMFNWYKETQVCYTYLSDVSLGPDESAPHEEHSFNSSFRSSKWFTRGWTLQELLAPDKLVFFDSQWIRIGERDDMWELVKEITGIQRYWRSSNVAQKMSWASKRETTRIEDRAYSLMGLFGVNMPPLYGEREKAFIRLQLEILRLSDDESIFAWRDPENFSGGLLAFSPNAFQRSSDVRRFISHDQPPYWMTNKGLCIERHLLRLRPEAYTIDSDDTSILPLQLQSHQTHFPYGIVLKRISGNQFARVSSGELLPLRRDALILPKATKTVYIRQTGPADDNSNELLSLPGYKFFLPTMPLLSKNFAVTNSYASGTSSWEDVGATTGMRQWGNSCGEGETGALEFTRLAGDSLMSTPPQPLERIVLIFDVYSNRSRMAVYLPNNDLSLDGIMAGLIKPGDWMTEKAHLFGPLKLKNGERIYCELVEKKGACDIWTYEAKVYFPD